MKTLARILIAVALLLPALLLAVPVQAGGCAVAVKKHAVVHHNAHVVEKVVAVKEVAVFVPLYYGTYQPHVAPSAPATDQAVVDVLKKISERLDRLERGGSQGSPQPRPSPMPPADPFNPPTAQQRAQGGEDFPGLVKSACASCHDAANAKARGGDFVLTKGGALAELSPEHGSKVLDRVLKGDMPPGNNWTERKRIDFVRSMVR